MMQLPSSDDFVNAGIITAAVFAVLLVALSTYGRRCRHPAVRSFIWGASIIFLPLTSSIISVLLRRSTENCNGTAPHKGKSNPDIQNMWTLLLWIVLILIIKGNADMAAAAVTISAASPASGDVSIDGQKVKPPVEHLAQYAWLAYLIVLCIPVAGWLGAMRKTIFIAFCVLGLAKMAFKLAAFWSASFSFALGKNARLISGYMTQLVQDGEEEGDLDVPRYIMMGEKTKHIELHPQGYRIKRDVLENKYSDLITLDRVWRLAHDKGGLLAMRQELRNLCLSYSLFKSLRRRLCGYPLAEAGSPKALDFVLRLPKMVRLDVNDHSSPLQLKDMAGLDSCRSGSDESADQLFNVLIDELWFASDFYYSPLPLCSFSGWCAVLNYLLSILIIVGAVSVGWIYQTKEVIVFKHSQAFYYIITFTLLLAVVLIEIWEIVSGIFSNWTKMALLCQYITCTFEWPSCRCAQVVLAAVLGFRPARRWRDIIGQNSVLEPRRFRKRSGLLAEQLYGRAGLMRSVVVSSEVKDAMLMSLKSVYGETNEDRWMEWCSLLQSSTRGEDGCHTTIDNILACHVGTRLLEMKYREATASGRSISDTNNMEVACHLSYYCAYLGAAAPELLPDSAAWTEKRYKEVVEDVRHALVSEEYEDGTNELMAERYKTLLPMLSVSSRDKVLRHGAEIARRLEKKCDEESASVWPFLAKIWSEMVIYVAPSENVKGHVEAMARGGEFITLIWTLLLHAGITTRPDTPTSSIYTLGNLSEV